MDNDMHMIVFSEDIEIVSTYMKRLNTAYALYYNTIKDRVGYVYNIVKLYPTENCQIDRNR